MGEEETETPEEKTENLLEKASGDPAKKLWKVLNKVDEVDKIIAGGRDISPNCIEHLEEADKKKVAGSESVRYDIGEIEIELVEDKKVRFSKDSVLLSDEGFEEKKQRYVEKLEAAGYKVE